MNLQEYGADDCGVDEAHGIKVILEGMAEDWGGKTSV